MTATDENKRTEASQPEIHVNVQNTNLDSNAHVWRVLGTIAAIAALVSLAYGLAEFGMLEMAATGTAATVAMLFQLLMRNGFIVLPESESDDQRIEEGKNALKAIVGMFQAILDRSSILRLTLIAIGYGIGFVLLRGVIAWALGVFTNIWIALAFGLLLAAFIVFPTLFAGIVKALKAKKGR